MSETDPQGLFAFWVLDIILGGDIIFLRVFLDIILHENDEKVKWNGLSRSIFTQLFFFNGLEALKDNEKY